MTLHVPKFTLSCGDSYLEALSSMGLEKALRAQTIAIFSYIDPVIAILLSVTVLHEPFSILSAVGSVLILGAAFVSEKT